MVKTIVGKSPARGLIVEVFGFVDIADVELDVVHAAVFGGSNGCSCGESVIVPKSLRLAGMDCQSGPQCQETGRHGNGGKVPRGQALTLGVFPAIL